MIYLVLVIDHTVHPLNVPDVKVESKWKRTYVQNYPENYSKVKSKKKSFEPVIVNDRTGLTMILSSLYRLYFTVTFCNLC